jgi:hypothetical protein
VRSRNETRSLSLMSRSRVKSGTQSGRIGGDFNISLNHAIGTLAVAALCVTRSRPLPPGREHVAIVPLAAGKIGQLGFHCCRYLDEACIWKAIAFPLRGTHEVE